jgi:hypothetical protein
LESSRGWRTVGAVNRLRLDQFREYLRRRPADSLVTLLSDDMRFRDTGKTRDAYAEAWSLTWFLIKRYPEQYVEYLKLLSSKKPMIWDDAPTRIREFQQVFGDDLKRLDAEFVRYILRGR